MNDGDTVASVPEVSAQEVELRGRFERDVLPLDGYLRGAAWGYTRNLTDAEDLVQDTFLLAFKAFNTFSENTYLKAWLLTIMRNTWITRYRASRRRPAENLVPDFCGFEGLAARPATVEVTTSAEHEVMRHVFDADVQRAQLELPTELRKTVYLVAVTRKSYREVGEILGVSPQTVGSRMHRIRALMRGPLAGFERKPRQRQCEQSRTGAA